MVLITDPDTMISSGTATLAEIIGESLCFKGILVVAIIILVLICAYEMNDLNKCIKEDKKYGSCRRSVKKSAYLMITLLFSNVAHYLGCMTGYPIFATIGSAIGGVLSGLVNILALDPILDYFELDVYSVDCANCGEKFECRRYEVGDQKECEKCRNKKID